MTIRPATASDAASLAALSTEVWLGTYLRNGINTFFADYVLGTFTKPNLAARIANPDEFIAVAEGEDGIIGFVGISTSKPAPVSGISGPEISTLYVRPRHHGAGHGRNLLHTGLHHCRTLGARTVWFTTNSENTPAIAFYQSHGFGHVGTTHFRIQDQAYPNHVLARNLATI